MSHTLESATELQIRESVHADLGGGFYTIAMGGLPKKKIPKQETRYVRHARQAESNSRESQAVEPNAQTLRSIDAEQKALTLQEIRKVRAQLSQVGVPAVASEVSIEPFQQTLAFPEPN